MHTVSQLSALKLRIFFAMVFTLVVGTTVWAPRVIAQESFQLWVGNIQVTTSNKNNVTGDGTVTFEPETSTLTLSNATLTQARESNGEFKDSTAIYSHVPTLTINVHGRNSIDLPSFTGNTLAIMHEGTGVLRFTGNGSLDIRTAEARLTNSGINTIGAIEFNGPEITVTNAKANSVSASGVFSTHGITVSAGSLTVESGEAEEKSYGIFTEGALNVTGGMISSGAPAQSSSAKFQSVGIRADKGVTISDAHVIARGHTRAFGSSVALEKADLPVLVNTLPQAEGAVAWDSITPIGGLESAFTYVEVGTKAPLGGSSATNNSWLNPLLAVIGVISGVAAALGVVAGILRSGIVPPHILPPQVRTALGL